MNRKQINRFLHAIGRKPASVAGDWVHAECPFAETDHQGGMDRNPSFGVLVMPGDSRVNCFSCDFKGTCGDVIVTMQRKGLMCRTGEALDVIIEAEDGAPLELEGEGYEEDTFTGPPQPHVYPEELLDAFEPAWTRLDQGALVHPYLAERHVPYGVVQELGLLHDPYRYRIVFPVRDFDRRLRGLHGRHIDGMEWAPDDPQVKYKMYPFERLTNPHIWLGEHWVDLDRPVLVAESVFDLARCLEVYGNTVSPLTASLKEAKLQRLRGALRVVTLFDADMAGDKARKRLRAALSCKVDHVLLPEGTDAADMPAGLLAEYLSPHLEVVG